MPGTLAELPAVAIPGHAPSGLGSPDHPMRIMTEARRRPPPRRVGRRGPRRGGRLLRRARPRVAHPHVARAGRGGGRRPRPRPARRRAVGGGLRGARQRHRGLHAAPGRAVGEGAGRGGLPRRCCGARPATPGHRVLADGARLPVAAGAADAVVLVNCFLFPDEVDRVLGPDGVVVWVNSSGARDPDPPAGRGRRRGAARASGPACRAPRGWAPGAWCTERRRENARTGRLDLAHQPGGDVAWTAHDTDRRPARRRADALLRALPPEDRRGESAPWRSASSTWPSSARPSSRSPTAPSGALGSAPETWSCGSTTSRPSPPCRTSRASGTPGPTSPRCSTTTRRPASRTSSPSAATRLPTARTPAGDFEHASELVEQVRAHAAGFSVAVAAHPEVHPRSPDRASDRRHLAAKLERRRLRHDAVLLLRRRLPAARRRARRAGLRQAGAPGRHAGGQRRRAGPHGPHERQRDPRAAPRAARGRGGPARGGRQDRGGGGHAALRRPPRRGRPRPAPLRA